MLHHNARWTHEGLPITHCRLREAFDRSVRFVPAESAFVIQLGRFRGRIEVEEAAFFVRTVDLASGTLALSDGSIEALDVATLRPSLIDGAWLCRVKTALFPGGLDARFSHAAQAELLGAVEDGKGGPILRLSGRGCALPDAIRGSD